MKKKLTVLFLCSIVAATGLGLYKNEKKIHPKTVAETNAPGKASDPAPLSFLSDEDMMKDSS
jgi:hypothetical protein